MVGTICPISFQYFHNAIFIMCGKVLKPKDGASHLEVGNTCDVMTLEFSKGGIGGGRNPKLFFCNGNLVTHVVAV